LTDESGEDKPSEALVIAQLTRVAEDYRQLDQLIWQIPTVAITVGSGVVAASHYVNDPYVSAAALFIGGVFEVTLAIALAKDRLQQDVTAVYLERLEKESHLPHLPVTTKGMHEYLGEKHVHASSKLLRERGAFKFLLGTVVLMAIALFATCAVEVLYHIVL
jgi:hypothetical protein